MHSVLVAKNRLSSIHMLRFVYGTDLRKLHGSGAPDQCPSCCARCIAQGTRTCEDLLFAADLLLLTVAERQRLCVNLPPCAKKGNVACMIYTVHAVGHILLNKLPEVSVSIVSRIKCIVTAV